MILSDSAIRHEIEQGHLKITTTDSYSLLDQIGPASLDFRLWTYFKSFKDTIDCIDTKVILGDEHYTTTQIPEWWSFLLEPGSFVLWVTLEKIALPYDLVARCEGRSSLGRLWLIIHSTAWFIDPWFEGTITLEITNINAIPLRLYPWMRIGQFAFERIEWTVQVPYDQRKGSKYMHQILPQGSKIGSDL